METFFSKVFSFAMVSLFFIFLINLFFIFLLKMGGWKFHGREDELVRKPLYQGRRDIPKTNILLRLVRGEVDLPLVFWVGGIFSLPVACVVLAILSNWAGFPFNYLGALIWVLYGFLITYSIWASADNYIYSWFMTILTRVYAVYFFVLEFSFIGFFDTNI